MHKQMQAVAGIGAVLASSLQSPVFPREALKLMAEAAGCLGCALHLARYKENRLDSFICLAAYPGNGGQTACAPEPSLLREAADYFSRAADAGHHTAVNGHRRAICFPLHLNDHISCILTVQIDIKSDYDTVVDFISSCIPLLSLWNSTSNIKKTLDDVCDFTREPLYIMNITGEVTLWNEAMSKLSGWDCSQIIGRGDYMNAVPFYGERRLTVPHLILNPDPEFETSHYMKFKREGDVVHALTFLPTVPQAGAYVSCKTQRLYDVNGVLYSAIHSLNDLTQLRQMEMDLHKLRFIGRLVNDLSETAIILLTREGVSYHNDKALEILEVEGQRKPTVEDLLAVADHVSGEEQEKLLILLRQVLAFQEPANPYIECSFCGKTGVRDIRCNAHIEPGEEPSVLLTFTDITRERELIAQAKENEMRILRADRLSALGVLAAGVAHEIAQPLSIIKVLADSYLYAKDAGWDNDDEDVSEHFTAISNQVDRMSKVIDGIRVFSRDEKEQDTSVSDVNQALVNILGILEQQFNNYGIHIRTVYCDEPLIVRCGLSRLEQVVMNLVVNSRQALEECAHPHKEISLVTARENDFALLRVADNGMGIELAELRKIFDPFFTTKEIGQGTGLGLTICKSIINNAGGDIEVWNNTSGGCTFQIYLPVAEAVDEDSAYR